MPQSIIENQDEMKNVVSLYKIDRSIFNEALSNSEIIEQIISKSNEYKKENNFLESKNQGFNISMYFLQKSTPYSKWEKFFSGVLSENNNTFGFVNQQGERMQFLGKYLSFICFFEKEKDIFALCMGKGYIAIERYIENDFGFNVLARLIKAENNLLKSITANHLSGATFENINFFRSSESFLSQDDFGKIFREAISQLDKKALEKLGIDVNDIDKTNCLAKSSFTLKTGLSFNQIVKKVLPSLVNLFDDSKNPINFEINKVKTIKKEDRLYEKLEEVLYEKMRLEFLNFDFFSPEDTATFFQAQKYGISKYTSEDEFFEKNLDDLTSIENVKKILEQNKLVNFSDPIVFRSEIQSIKINAYDDEESKILRRGFSLPRGLHGEIEHNGEKYFWMNGKFWHIDKKFLDYFNDKVFQNISEKVYTDIPDKIPFKKYDLAKNDTEGTYNESHEKVAGFLNLDKKTPHGVELCDLLFETDNTIYLIHVKKGFDRNIRDLASQILTATRFLFEDRNKNIYLKGVFKHSKGKKISGTEKQFLKKFKKKTIFVFAFINSKNIFDKLQFEALGSNIAKLELFELLKEFKKFNPPYDLKIIQVPLK